MELSDEEKRKALLAAQGIKETMRVDSVPATSETLQEMETGSPRTPGYDEHSGKTMKSAAELPQEQEVQPKEQNRDEQTPVTSGSADANVFEQALAEKLQEATHASLDKPRDIDR